MSSATRYRSCSILSTAVLMALASASASAAPAEARSKQTPDPSDPQIAAIVVAANTVDIKNGELAKDTSKNAFVQEFAEQDVIARVQVEKEGEAR